MSKNAGLDPELKRLVDLSALIAILIITAVLPLAYWQARVAQEKAAVDTLSSVYASLVMAVIAQKPDLWQFEEHKLLSLVEHDAARDGPRTVYSITDARRQRLVASSPGAAPGPAVVRESPLFDATEVVGHYRVERSLRPVLTDTAMVTLLALLGAILCAVPLRALPLRALRRSQERLLYMAKHDVLTGLPNRSLLDDRLGQALFYAQRYETRVSVAFIDLDNFKTVNDGLGHDAGDELLVQMAQRLTKAVRTTDTVVRLGGDEFVVVLFDQPEAADALVKTLERLMRSASEPMDVRGHTVQLGCSIGVATYPSDGLDASTLLKHADAAMYRAKESGKNSFQLYTADMSAKTAERLSIQDGLLKAISRDEFFLEYQPQVDLETNQVIGVEALLRWRHPELGVVPPVRFIPVAEDSGVIVALGEWVLRTACAQHVAWHRQGLPAVKLSVNVSRRQFREPDYAESVARVLQETGMRAELLELEITESLIMEDVPRAIAVMHRIRDLGVQLSIDDFGTGYSSLSSLKNFPVGRLKIDRSFVNMLPGDADDCVLAKAIIALGHQLNLKVVAEGVETLSQREFLRQNNCDEMQGFHFSRPISAEHLESLLAATVTGARAVDPDPIAAALAKSPCSAELNGATA